MNQYQVIGYKAFAANPTLENLILPQAIREIKPQAFLDCIHLKQVSLPAAIEAIGAGAFSGCDSLETIQIQPNSNYTVVGGMLIDKKNKTLMRVTKSASSKCNIPCEITTIQPRAFERIDICSIILPRNLSVLSGNAFVFCEKLESFEIDRHNALYSTIEGVLHSKDRKQLIRFPSGYQGVNYIVEDSVEHIADGAFAEQLTLRR